MASTATIPMTAASFFEWSQQPENRHRHFELVQGEIIEMPPAGERHGLLCWLIAHYLGQYVIPRGGYLLTNDTGLLVQTNPDTVRGPDVMLFLKPQTFEDISPELCQRLPDLIVEVFSPHDRPGKLNRRINEYHQYGVPLVWVVFPEERSINVYRPNEFPKVLDETDTLTGNEVLPDLELSVARMFQMPNSNIVS